MAKDKSAQAPKVDRDLIRELAKLLDETGLTEIEIERDGAARARRRAAATSATWSRGAIAAAPLAGATPASPQRPPPIRQAIRASSPRRWSAPPISGPAPGAKPFVEVGSKVVGRRNAAHRRSDEDDEPDPGAALRHGDADPDRGRAAGRVRRAAHDHRVSSGARRRDVRQNPHRQPRRDRAARAARLPGARHPDGRGAFDRRRRRHACAPRRRERLHRPAAGARQLSQHSGAARRLRDHRRRRRASGLRLPVGERPLRRNPRRARHPFHRPARPSTSA